MELHSKEDFYLRKSSIFISSMGSQADTVQDESLIDCTDRTCLLSKINDEQAEPSTQDISELGIKKQPNKKRKVVKYNLVMSPMYAEIFLKVIYPLSGFLEKNVMVGVFKLLDFTPGVLLNHTGKSILFTEAAWNSFSKHMNLIECYMLNKVYGKKTSVRLSSSDIEVENIKHRNSHCIRFRNLSKHDEKIVLNAEEFFTMITNVPAINRYMQQLAFSSSVVKDYLMDTINVQPNSPLLYGPVDTSVYNRLPQEVSCYRTLLKTRNITATADCEEELPISGVCTPPVNEDDECSENEGVDTVDNK